MMKKGEALCNSNIFVPYDIRVPARKIFLYQQESGDRGEGGPLYDCESPGRERKRERKRRERERERARA